MKKIALVLFAFILVSCSPKPQLAPVTIETAIIQIQTQKAVEQIVKATILAEPSSIPTPSNIIPTEGPKNLDYLFIDIERNFPNKSKCIIDIRINEMVSENDLRLISNSVLSNEGKGCSPLGVFFFLPDDQPGVDSAWAYGTFNPELEVGINGMTIEGKSTLESTKPKIGGNVIGSWFDTGAFPRIITIEKMGDGYQFTSVYDDGSGETKMLGVKKVNGEVRLFENPGNYYGDYMLIESNGNLAFYDKQGFIYEISPK